MGFVRRRLIGFVMTVSLLGGAFDGCLVDCHAQAMPTAGAAMPPHCHPAPAQPVSGASTGQWQADPTCRHDHTIAAAEGAVRVRLDSRPLAVLAPLDSLSVPLAVSISPLATRSAADSVGPTVVLAPLRV